MILKEPLFLLLLILLPLLGKLFTRSRRLQNQAAETLRGTRELPGSRNRKDLLMLSSLAALILALAQPAWNPHPGPLSAQGRDMVIALDISRSMLASDVFPTRLEAAKIAMFESLDELQGQRIGLITFAGAASVRVPLTLDHNFIRYMLERARPADADVGSTSLQAAIEKAIDTALSESKKGTQDIILFTDGEDHISNIEQTTEELRECGARVLIIGLGDAVSGAKVPEIGSTNTWMQYKGADVITRLDEKKLLQLSSQSPNVTYHAAGTRPYDLIDLYRNMILSTSGLITDDETQLVYTEGYPYLIALALILWLAPLGRRLFPAAALLLLMTGCAKEPAPAAMEIQKGRALWTDAQNTLEADPISTLYTLSEAQHAFLQAAMLDPGNLKAAQQIAGITQQMVEVEKAVKQQQQEQQDLQQQLAEAVEKLRILTAQETELSNTSRKLLRKRPAVSKEEKGAAVQPSLEKQIEIRTQTTEVLSTVGAVQRVVQKMLEKVYGNADGVPPTEFDDAVNELITAQQSQQNAIGSLQPESTSWAQANSAFHSASRHMKEALALLDQSSGQGEGEDGEFSEEDYEDWDFEEGMEWDESEMSGNMSMPMESQDFKSDLSNQSLPTPNYTAEDIMMEEASNMEKRAQQKSKASGANVEKNW